MKRIAITACPYSGTMHTVLTLRALGLDVCHEVYGADGIVSWRHVNMDKPDFVADGFSENMALLQQVAHPLMVISRLRQVTTGYKHPATKEHIWESMKNITNAMDADWNIDAEEPPLDKVKGLLVWMRLWFWWNKAGAEKADAVFRIEKLPDRWEWFLEQCGIYSYVAQPTEYKKHNLAERKVNRKKTRKILSWDDLYAVHPGLTLDILDLAAEFGYNQEPTEYLNDEFYEFPEQIELTTRGNER